MKKLIFLIAILFVTLQVQAQKFVYGDLRVSGNAYVNGSVYTNTAVAVPYLNVDSIITGYLQADSIDVSYLVADSILLGSQKIVYAAGDSLPDITYVNTNYSGALTDGAPTEAEIIGIAGTAASVGAGFKAVIKDTDGTGLYYLVISTGAAWYYFAGTLAL
jgi:hypothetical protein